MPLGYDLASDAAPVPAQAGEPLASWYAPGLSDALGDRLLMFDNSSAPSLELLRFSAALTAKPGFEVALRRRVERLRHFRHTSFARVRAIEYLGPGEGLALLSNYTPGKRLSEVLRDARGPAFATALIQQVTPALASLEEYGEGTGHGALVDSRIVVAPQGRLVIVEHVLGPALERLQLPASRWRTELGIAVPPHQTPYLRLDGRTDYFQLGLIALSVLLGRRLDPRQTQENLASLLEQVARTANADSPVLFGRLRVWLERALQLDDQVFESSEDARQALKGLSATQAFLGAADSPRYESVATEADVPIEPSLSSERKTAPETGLQAEAPADVLERDDLSQTSVPELSADAENPSYAKIRPAEPVVDQPEPPDQECEARVRFQKLEPYNSNWWFETGVAAPAPAPVTRPPSVQQPHVPRGGSMFVHLDLRDFQTKSEPRRSRTPIVESRPSMDVPAARVIDRFRATRPNGPQKSRPYRMHLLVLLLGVGAIGEGIVIATLLMRGEAATPSGIHVETLTPGADVQVDGRSAGLTPLQLSVGADTKAIRVIDPPPQPLDVAGSTAVMPHLGTAGATPPPPSVPAVDAVRAAAPRVGGVRLVSPIEVEVFEGDRWLGSSATGIVSMAEGRHELELVNSFLGYRTRQNVEVRNGQVVTVRLVPPSGRLSINALPWAEVWIGGKSVGETPLGNLSVPLGEHEIIFRHPQLGEQRRTAVVRLDGVTRVSANLQR